MAKLLEQKAARSTDDAVKKKLLDQAAKFRANTAEFADRIRLMPTSSRAALARLTTEEAGYDLVFVDGSHESQDVLDDATGSWSLLRPGGWLVFDDYGWSGFADPARTPAPGIDAFLLAHTGEYVEVHRDWQVVVRRLPAG